jgi:hypothetical protein
MVRTYDVYAIRNDKEYKLNTTPMTHKQACTFKSKFTIRKETTYMLKEIA